MFKILPIGLFTPKRINNLNTTQPKEQAYPIQNLEKDTFTRSVETETPKLIISYGDENTPIKKYYQNHLRRLNELEDEEKIIRNKHNNFEPKDFTTDDFVYSNRGYADGITDTMALLLYNNKRGMLIHVSPYAYQDEEKQEQLQNFIYKTTDLLQEISPFKPVAWIVGGTREKSKGLHNTICVPLDIKNIKTNEIIFSTNEHNEKSIFFDIPDRKIYIDGGYYPDKSSLFYHYETVRLF